MTFNLLIRVIGYLLAILVAIGMQQESKFNLATFLGVLAAFTLMIELAIIYYPKMTCIQLDLLRAVVAVVASYFTLILISGIFMASLLLVTMFLGVDSYLKFFIQKKPMKLLLLLFPILLLGFLACNLSSKASKNHMEMPNGGIVPPTISNPAGLLQYSNRLFFGLNKINSNPKADSSKDSNSLYIIATTSAKSLLFCMVMDADRTLSNAHSITCAFSNWAILTACCWSRVSSCWDDFLFGVVAMICEFFLVVG